MIHIGNIDDVVTSDLVAMCTRRAHNFKRRGRDIDRIIYNTIIGESVEILVCNHLNLNQVDFEIAEYDAIDRNGIRYEIKHTNKDDKWWNFDIDNYSFFLDNAYKLDRIVLCYHDKESGNVYLKFNAHAPTFNDYSQKSNYNDKYYYNVDIASRNMCCLKY